MQTSDFVQSLQRHTYIKRKVGPLPTTNTRRVSFHVPYRYYGSYLIAG